jgi:hypothetical protein
VDDEGLASSKLTSDSGRGGAKAGALGCGAAAGADAEADAEPVASWNGGSDPPDAVSGSADSTALRLFGLAVPALPAVLSALFSASPLPPPFVGIGLLVPGTHFEPSQYRMYPGTDGSG